MAYKRSGGHVKGHYRNGSTWVNEHYRSGTTFELNREEGIARVLFAIERSRAWEEEKAIRQAEWEERQRVRAIKQAEWEERQRVRAIKQAEWEERQRIHAIKQAEWKERQRVRAIKQTEYEARKAKWEEREKERAIKQAEYEERQRVRAIKQAEWKERQRVRAIKQTEYEARKAKREEREKERAIKQAEYEERERKRTINREKQAKYEKHQKQLELAKNNELMSKIKNTSPAFRKGNDSNIKTIIILSAPGQAEEKAGRPAAGQTGITLQGAIEFWHNALPNEFPSSNLDDYTIVNAVEDIHYKAKTGRTEGTNKEVCNKDNMARVNAVIADAEYIVALGYKAKLTVSKSVFKGKIYAGAHPSMNALNTKYSSKKQTPRERSSDRINQWAGDILLL